MGLIERGKSEAVRVSDNEAELAFFNLLSGNYAGAWLFLKQAGDQDMPAVLFNKALCELTAGQPEDALRSLLTAQRRNPPYPGFLKELSGMGVQLLKQQDTTEFPYQPMEPQTAQQFPAYTAFRIQWLLILTLLECKRTEEALAAAAKLSGQYEPESLRSLLKEKTK